MVDMDQSSNPYILFTGILLFVLVMQVDAQNLVPNFSFEEHDKCPGDFSHNTSDFRVNDWRSGNTGTPDYFNVCSVGEANVPHNWAGVSDAYEGESYVGIYLWMNTKNNYREYLQCTLTEPLLKDSLYLIEFHYKLSSYSKYSIDRIGLVLTDSMISIKNDQVIPLHPTVSIVKDSALSEQTGYWEIAKQKYFAKGGEYYLTIGNFFDNQSTRNYFIRFRSEFQKMLANGSYYYIDDVKVIPFFKQALPIELKPVFNSEFILFDKLFILKNIQFAFDQYALQTSSYKELNDLADWLKENPSVSVMLMGHTDDQGSDEYNLWLSLNRAKSVAVYLATQGIASTRIETFGYGNLQPVVNSIDEDARNINRRVEIKFIKN